MAATQSAAVEQLVELGDAVGQADRGGLGVLALGAQVRAGGLLQRGLPGGELRQRGGDGAGQGGQVVLALRGGALRRPRSHRRARSAAR